VQLAWGIFDLRGKPIEVSSHIVKPRGFRIPADATAIHGITHSRALKQGRELAEVLDEFLAAIEVPEVLLVAHNLSFDLGVVGAEIVRSGKSQRLFEIPGICTMKTTSDLLRLPRWGGRGYKWPTLEELHSQLFGQAYDRPHDAAEDLHACARCFFMLLKEGYYSLPDGV
jgi:DNA polymerase III epsilon subunit-like protein